MLTVIFFRNKAQFLIFLFVKVNKVVIGTDDSCATSFATLSITSFSQDTVNGKLFCEAHFTTGKDNNLQKNHKYQDLSHIGSWTDIQSLF